MTYKIGESTEDERGIPKKYNILFKIVDFGYGRYSQADIWHGRRQLKFYRNKFVRQQLFIICYIPKPSFMSNLE